MLRVVNRDAHMLAGCFDCWWRATHSCSTLGLAGHEACWAQAVEEEEEDCRGPGAERVGVDESRDR